jgi:fused signal recognition particle receptor
MVFWRKKKVENQEGSQLDKSADKSLENNGNKPNGPTPSDDADAEQVSWYRRALAKTNEWLRTDIRDLWKSEGQLVDDQFLSDLYATLVRTDMGGMTASKIRDSISNTYRSRKIEFADVLSVVREQVKESLKSKNASLRTADQGPTVILVVGVNGSGKTTSIAKLANRLTQQGNRVLLGAGDTFRAAAVEQLKIWSERIGCDIVLGEHGSDPGSVVYKTVQRAVAESYDVCILDTAGRLQTQSNLMQQLEKMKRIIQKQIEGAPHEVLLVLDATAGQNAISQAKGFSEAAGCTGIVLAKMDGTAKGGVIVPIAEQFGLPVKFIGIGEKLDDISEFDPDGFAEALF